MAISCSAEIDSLLIELGASLDRSQRVAFEAAARAALAATGCSGVGAAYRILGPIQRAHWDAPPDLRVSTGARHYRESKLQALPAIGGPDPREGGRDRNSFRVG
jgi:hypothetical protein